MWIQVQNTKYINTDETKRFMVRDETWNHEHNTSEKKRIWWEVRLIMSWTHILHWRRRECILLRRLLCAYKFCYKLPKVQCIHFFHYYTRWWPKSLELFKSNLILPLTITVCVSKVWKSKLAICINMCMINDHWWFTVLHAWWV